MGLFRSVQYPAIIDSQGEQTNPTTATVMADTGALTAGQLGVYEVRVILSASADAEFAVQHRNAANGANVEDPAVVYVPGTASGQYLFEFCANNVGERFRVMMNANLTGDAAAYVAAKRVG